MTIRQPRARLDALKRNYAPQSSLRPVRPRRGQRTGRITKTPKPAQNGKKMGGNGRKMGGNGGKPYHFNPQPQS